MLQHLCSAGKINRDMSVLVVCGTQLDADVFAVLGMHNVTVSNLDERHEGSWDTGAGWDRQNAESLTCPDAAYDIVAVHAGLHHCRYPHKALCEMYRVARVGVFVMEPCENFMVRVGRWLGVGQEFEVHAVAYHKLESGGVNNTAIPNYVYRWTECEINQTISAYAPEFRHRISVRTYLIVHWHDLLVKKNPGRLLLMLVLFLPLKVMSLFSKRFGNMMGVFIEKAGASDLHPWLELCGHQIRPSRGWFDRHLHVGR